MAVHTESPGMQTCMKPHGMLNLTMVIRDGDGGGADDGGRGDGDSGAGGSCRW